MQQREGACRYDRRGPEAEIVFMPLKIVARNESSSPKATKSCMTTPRNKYIVKFSRSDIADAMPDTSKIAKIRPMDTMAAMDPVKKSLDRRLQP